MIVFLLVSAYWLPQKALPFHLHSLPGIIYVTNILLTDSLTLKWMGFPFLNAQRMIMWKNFPDYIESQWQLPGEEGILSCVDRPRRKPT